LSKFGPTSKLRERLKSLSLNKKIFRNSGPSDAFNHYMKDTLAGNSFNAPGDYRIEISGWGVDNSFFVERGNLVWRADGEKQVHLLRELPEGAMIFIRSISSDPSNLSVPVAYKVKTVTPIDSQGRYQTDLMQMRPRGKQSSGPKESLSSETASNNREGKKSCETNEPGMALEHEEILR
jgi:hypothetical protein